MTAVNISNTSAMKPMTMTNAMNMIAIRDQREIRVREAPKAPKENPVYAARKAATARKGSKALRAAPGR